MKSIQYPQKVCETLTSWQTYYCQAGCHFIKFSGSCGETPCVLRGIKQKGNCITTVS